MIAVTLYIRRVKAWVKYFKHLTYILNNAEMEETEFDKKIEENFMLPLYPPFPQIMAIFS